MQEREALQSDLLTHVTALKSQQRHSQALGFVETALPAVRLFWAESDIARAPLRYTPGIAVIVSGRKIGYVDDQRIAYGPGQYLAVGLPLYFECETFATKEAPLVGLFLGSETVALGDLAQDLAAHDRPLLPAASALGIEPLVLPETMLEATVRLARQLRTPAEAAVLGENTLTEIFFHALQDRHGRVLLGQTQSKRPEARIAQVLRALDEGPGAAASIDSLAQAVGMSSASFHRHFKAVTGLSPLQYQKRRRLMRAKSLLTFDKLSVNETARAVGYASPTQFSRDFSAYFGMPPSRAELSVYPA
ncbi:MAG: AraC family transcriptional regulator [Pseudomonadota bacterium]